MHQVKHDLPVAPAHCPQALTLGDIFSSVGPPDLQQLFGTLKRSG